MIEAILSESHTSRTALHTCLYLCLFACSHILWFNFQLHFCNTKLVDCWFQAQLSTKFQNQTLIKDIIGNAHLGLSFVHGCGQWQLMTVSVEAYHSLTCVQLTFSLESSWTPSHFVLWHSTASVRTTLETWEHMHWLELCKRSGVFMIRS